ncbi:hypothetical protein FIBSPDRAFT_842475 [Athelia psychrophila]|uniref:BTB domain-containing protein n=1 Tax=Athelia psychrophila TaxID=1759441 RepID=A0A167WG43_9AGAM|nr:hypothetical protein FIBSPDRAFT_842475 [Fibularhizoctonia sp. CBS 109695]
MASNPGPAESDISKHSEPWFEDGNIILETEHTQFKVYKGILAANSSVFGDMFAFNQGDVDQMEDNCPIVQLYDRADDLRVVLNTLHDSKLLKEHQGKFPFHLLVAYLRLGRKYMITHLLEIAMAKLALEFPTTLQDHQAHFPPEIVLIQSWPRFIDIRTENREHFTMVNILREQNLQRHIPYALFICAALDFQETEDSKSPWTLYSQPGSSYHDNQSLSFQDLQACTRGQKIISRLIYNETFSWTLLDANVSECGINRCHFAKAFLLSDLAWKTRLSSALSAWDSNWEEDICEGHLAAFRRRQDEGSQNIWNRLPAIFGMPPWEELLNEA